MANTDKSDRIEGGGGINTGVAIIGMLLCFLAGGFLTWSWDARQGANGGGIHADTASGAAWSDSDSPIPVTSNDPVWGKREAPVTVVIFSDFQCPFCSRVEPTLDQVKSTYGPDKVRLVWKNEPLPFHDKAKPAAEAAQAVFLAKGSEAFWKFHDTAFKNQKDLSAENYEKWAVASGVDAAKFKEKLKGAAKKVEEDHEVAKKSGISGTPGFMINGVLLSGAQPFDKFKAVIDEQLEKANAKIKAGTPKEKVYVAMTTENKKNAPAKPADDDEEPAADDKTVFAVPIGNSPILGDKNAPVTVLVFSDFECPFCKRVEPSLKEIREKYGSKVRMVWKHEPLPFHKKAKPAAQFSMEARAQKGDKGFWDAHDKLFENQPKIDEADLERIAGEMGLNVEKVKAAIKDEKYKKDIDADSELAEDVQASGTPHFFINGRRLVGAQPTDKFVKIIDEELKKAQDLIAKGTPADKVYETVMKEAKSTRKMIALPPGAPFRGGANAKVVIQEFSDFECPFCGKVEPQLAEVMKTYGDKVKIVWRDKPLPFHKKAPLAAQAAREAYKQKGNDAFWKMHDKMFENQSKPDGLSRESLDTYAKEIGLDMGKWKAALDGEVHKAAMDLDDKAATEAGVSGTPHFNINGYTLSGAQPFDKFKKVIDKALNETQK